MEKKALSETSAAALNFIRESDHPVTMKEVNEAGIDAKPGHFTGLKKRGLIESTKEPVIRQGKRKVKTYRLGEIGDKLTEKETTIINAARELEEGFTVADLSEKLGFKAVVGSLVKKGYLVAIGTVEMPTQSKGSISLYSAVDVDDAADAE